MQVIGDMIAQLFTLKMPFFGYTITFGQVFIGGWLLALLVYFIRRIFA